MSITKNRSITIEIVDDLQKNKHEKSYRNHSHILFVV